MNRPPTVEPGLFALQPGLAAGQQICRWRRGFIHPFAVLVAVDAGGGEVARPLQRQSIQQWFQAAQARVLPLAIRRGCDQQMADAELTDEQLQKRLGDNI